MLELFHDKALELAAAVDPDEPATARFMLPACQAADKALLLAGLIRKTADGVTAVDIADDYSELDRELRQAVAELEDRMRADSPPWTGHGRPSPGFDGTGHQNGQGAL